MPVIAAGITDVHEVQTARMIDSVIQGYRKRWTGFETAIT